MAAGENFKFIFREAKINDAILFFDECEAIFETREHGGHNVNLLLTEIERYYHSLYVSITICVHGFVYMHVCMCYCVSACYVCICAHTVHILKK